MTKREYPAAKTRSGKRELHGIRDQAAMTGARRFAAIQMRLSEAGGERFMRGTRCG